MINAVFFNGLPSSAERLTVQYDPTSTALIRRRYDDLAIFDMVLHLMEAMNMEWADHGLEIALIDFMMIFKRWVIEDRRVFRLAGVARREAIASLTNTVSPNVKRQLECLSEHDAAAQMMNFQSFEQIMTVLAGKLLFNLSLSSNSKKSITNHSLNALAEYTGSSMSCKLLANTSTMRQQLASGLGSLQVFHHPS